MVKAEGPLSGFQDILPEQKIPRDHMINAIKGVYESYGFVPLETPTVERLETLTGKYGEEGEQLMYKFKDHGGRDLALRYDLTVPLARVVAQYDQQLPMPFKRYQIGSAFRGESPQKGRNREFTQLDADIVGTKSVIADAEVLAMMTDTMQTLGANAVVRVNNRRILDGLVETAEISNPEDARFLVSTIDKVEKIGNEEVLSVIDERLGSTTATLVAKYLSVEGGNQDRIQAIGSLLNGSEATEEGVTNLQSVFSMLEEAGYSADRIQFDQTIARGLNYYTGIIYETTLLDMPNIGSVCSGGRYDNLVKDSGGPDLPAVGTSVGVDRLFPALLELGVLHSTKTFSDVMVLNFEQSFANEYVQIASELRRQGIPAEIIYDSSRIGKQLKQVDKLGIPYAVIVGSRELEKGIALVRDMKSGEQHEVPLAELPSFIDTLKNS